nr:uncharacterized protein LOC113701259 [Coffea arabica]
MFDFGDEFVIESQSVPWLIWAQLLVTILLVVILFFGFSIFALDRFSNPSCSSASSSSQSHGKDALLNKSSSSHGSKVEESQSIQRETEASAYKATIGEEIEERDEASVKDIALLRLLGQGNHPCHYMNLAKQAILKCFGLGYTSERSHSCKHRKED